MENILAIEKIKGLPIVGVHFMDHAECQGKPEDFDPFANYEITDFYECYVVGFLKKETELAYQVVSWVCDRDFNDWETRTDVILKCTLLSPVRILADLVKINGLPEKIG